MAKIVTPRRSSRLEPLEHRMLMSAALDVLVIDHALPDADALLASADKRTQVVAFDSRSDRLADVLERVSDLAKVEGQPIDSLAIVSHGSSGRFALGSRWVNGATVYEDAAAWSKLGEHLAPGGNIYIYACEAGEGQAGQTLLDSLAELTGADIFASDDLTGTGGDWELEVASAGDDAELQAMLKAPLDAGALADYQATLAGPTISGATFSISEGAADGDVLGTVSATDPEGHPIRYAITAGNDDGAFAINEYTGEVYVADSSLLDYETKTQYSLTVEAVDTNVYEDFDWLGTDGTALQDGAIFSNWQSAYGDVDALLLGPEIVYPPNATYNAGDSSANRALGVYAGAAGDERWLSANVEVGPSGSFYIEFDMFFAYARQPSTSMRWGGVAVYMTGAAEEYSQKMVQSAGTVDMTWYNYDTAADKIHIAATFTGMAPGTQTITFNFRGGSGGGTFSPPPGYAGSSNRHLVTTIDNIIGDGSASGTPDTATVTINLLNDTSDDASPTPPPPADEPPADDPTPPPPPLDLLDPPSDPFQPPEVAPDAGVDSGVSDLPEDIVEPPDPVPGGFDTGAPGGPAESSAPPPETPVDQTEITQPPVNEPTDTQSTDATQQPDSPTDSPTDQTADATDSTPDTAPSDPSGESATASQSSNDSPAADSGQANASSNGNTDSATASGSSTDGYAPASSTAGATSAEIAANVEAGLDVGDAAVDPPWAGDENAAPRTVEVEKVIETREFFKRADESKDEADEERWQAEVVTVGTSLSVSAGLSAGYLIWCLQGSSLATSLITALPLWRFFDPLSIVETPKLETARRAGPAGQEDEEDLISLVK